MTTRSTLFMLLLGGLLTACSGDRVRETGAYLSTIAEETGESFALAREPVFLAAQRPALSAIGKDYLVFSPLTTNATGAPETYLWFTLGSTIDRPLTGVKPPEFNAIVLLLDGSMMTFDLIPGQDIAKAQPIDIAMQQHASYAARVTRHQLNRIGAAGTLEAWVTNGDSRSPLYRFSRGDWSDWGRF